MDSAVRAVLQAARDLIADPARWGQGHFAVDAAGAIRAARDPRAARRCADAAIQRAAWDQGWTATVAHAAYAAVRPPDVPRRQWNLPIYNDTHTHAEVLALFDQALAAG